MLDQVPFRVKAYAANDRPIPGHAFPNVWLCEWHLREELRLRLVRAKANTSSDRVWRRLEAAAHHLD